MKFKLYLAISISLVFLLACNFTVSTQEGDDLVNMGGPTDTPEPTNVVFDLGGVPATATPTPSSTATPTDTATFVPSATLTATTVPPTATPVPPTATLVSECQPVYVNDVPTYPENYDGLRCSNGKWVLETGE